MTRWLTLGGVMIFGMLTGCMQTRQAVNDRFPDLCDVKQADKDGQGYTVGQFPCSLKHVSGEKKP